MYTDAARRRPLGRTIVHVALVLVIAFGTLGAAGGYWAVIRGPELTRSPFDAAVIAGVPERDKRRLKEWAFLVSGLRTLFGWNPEQRKFQPFQPPEMRVRGVGHDGQAVDVRGYFVAVGNVSDYGSKLFPFMRGARLDDGLLDVIVVRTRDLRELLNIGTQVVARTHLGHPLVTAFQSSAEIVMAPGSVIKEPSTGPSVRIASHHAAGEPPPSAATRRSDFSANTITGRVDASAMTTTTKSASV